MNFQEIGRFEAAGKAVLGEYGMEQWKFELLHCSENATFLVTEPENRSGDWTAECALTGENSAGGVRKRVMRVARPGYHTLEELESEIKWVEKIWEEQVIPVARPVRNRRGDGVTVVAWQPCNHFACVIFEFLPGHAPDPKHDVCALEDFREIGRMAAKLHEQVIHWPEAETLSRPHWDYEHMLGVQGLFGDWRLCLELDKSGFQTIERVCEKIRQNLTNYGKTRENYGLIHSDLRAANLLKDEHCIHAIDFDDSGFGWFLYDAAAAISLNCCLLFAGIIFLQRNYIDDRFTLGQELLPSFLGHNVLVLSVGIVDSIFHLHLPPFLRPRFLSSAAISFLSAASSVCFSTLPPLAYILTC